MGMLVSGQYNFAVPAKHPRDCILDQSTGEPRPLCAASGYDAALT